MKQSLNASRFAFREAILHMRRYLDQRQAKWPVRMLKYADALIHACWLDFYGVGRADTLVIGPDRMLNLIIAIRCAAKGQTVYVCEGDQQQWDGYDGVLRHRLKSWHPSFTGLVEASLAVRLDPMKIEQGLCEIASSYANDNGTPLVLAPHRISLFSDKLTRAGKRFRFWVEPGHSPSIPGIAQLDLWKISSANIYDTEEGKADRFSLEVDRVIMTGVAGPSLGNTLTEAIRIGEALRPIGTFTVFRTKDRLQDVAESLGADLS